MSEYKPLFVYLEPTSIPQVVAHIQKYLSENPIISDEETIAELIREYIAAHPEIIAVASVNGKVGAVVLTGSDIMINSSSAVSVETQLLNLASMINNTGADVTQIQANISQIYTDIGTLQTSVEGHGTRLATAESDIDALESAQSAQNTRLNTAEGNISSIQTRLAGAETDIDALESAQSAQNTRLNTAEGNISSIQTRLNTAEGNISSLQTKIASANFTPILQKTYSNTVIKKLGDICFVNFSINNLSQTLNYVKVAAFPNGFKPSTLQGSALLTNSSNSNAHCDFKPDGLFVETSASVEWINISGFYFV